MNKTYANVALVKVRKVEKISDADTNRDLWTMYMTWGLLKGGSMG